jgi:hypothetical protein
MKWVVWDPHVCALFYSPSKICFSVFHHIPYVRRISCVCVYTNRPTDQYVKSFSIFSRKWIYEENRIRVSFFLSIFCMCECHPQIFHSHYTLPFLLTRTHFLFIIHPTTYTHTHPTFIFILIASKEKLFLKHTLRYRLDLSSHPQHRCSVHITFLLARALTPPPPPFFEGWKWKINKFFVFSTSSMKNRANNRPVLKQKLDRNLNFRKFCYLALVNFWENFLTLLYPFITSYKHFIVGYFNVCCCCY